MLDYIVYDIVNNSIDNFYFIWLHIIYKEDRKWQELSPLERVQSP